MKIKRYLILTVLALITVLLASGCGSSKSDISTDDPLKAFDIAKRKFDKKDYVDAIEDFSLIKIRFPGTEVSDKVQFYLAKSYYYQKEYIFAMYEFDSFLKNHQASPLYPEAKYMLGMTFYALSPKFSLDQEYTKEARDEFLSFIEQFPEDKNVPDAEAKARELQNKLAFKDYWTGELYIKLDNNKAAALYFQNVIENYIDSDWTDDAMVSQAEAYINGKKYDEAKKVLERFYKMFPKSELKSKADRLNSRIREFQTSN